MIELSGVTKRYGERVALHPLDLAIPRGRTTVLIGTSGCGKSTLIRMLVGLVEPDGGTLAFDGVPYRTPELMSLRRRMGYVIQEGGLFPHLTARRNVALLPRHLGWDAARIDARVTELAQLVQLPGEALDRYPVELSGGQRQRVSLMRALALDPDVLLLDEPLGAVDPLVRAELSADLRAIFRRLGKTVVMVTHDMGEAAFFGDLVVLLREGRVVQKGPLSELLERPADPFVTRFINAQRSPLEALRAGGPEGGDDAQK